MIALNDDVQDAVVGKVAAGLVAMVVVVAAAMDPDTGVVQQVAS